MLEKMGKTVAYLGPSGAGQAAKATNQIMCAGIIQAVGEAMAFAHAEGLPLDRLIEMLGKGAGSSWYFVNRAPFMAQQQLSRRAFACACTPRICASAARWPRSAARSCRSSNRLWQQYAQLIVQGFGDEDISAIYRLKSALFPAAARSPHDRDRRGALQIATRKSQLALWQAEHVATLLRQAHAGLAVELLPMSTKGDRIQDRASPRSAARVCSSRSSKWPSKSGAPTSPCIR